MSELTPCPECQRHVRKTETSCPFCGQALSLSHLPTPALPGSRLGRAATFAFGATLIGATSLVGCGGESEGKKDRGSGGASGGTMPGSTTAGDSPGGAGIAPLYGAPTAGTNGATGGTSGATGGTDSDTGGAGPVYGAPAAGSGYHGGCPGVPPQ
jgi:hypothetical protein